MNASKIFEVYDIFEKDELAIVYQGDFSNFALGMLTQLVKEYLFEDKSLVKLRNKLSFLIIEAFQNTMRYGDHQYKDQSDLVHELFILRNIEEIFYIITANLIENSRIGYVHSKLNEVNNLDKEQLKELYVKVLTNRKLTERGGAGLGFIEMVRKTKEKIDFDFTPVSEEASFFYFQMKLKKEKTKIPKQYLPISEAKKIHQIVSDHNIIIIHKGDYDSKTILPLLKMAEQNFTSESLSYQKKTFLIFVEILQNISKHSAMIDNKHKGISFIAYKDGKYIISSGNFIENKKIKDFKDKLDYYSTLSKDQLNHIYISSLRTSSAAQGGLGLIDIFRETSKINYFFKEIDPKFSFFSITIEV